MKKGLLGSQSIFYVLTGIVFVFILYFGVSSLGKVKDSDQMANYVMFKDDLTRDVLSIKNNYGTQKKFSYDVPNNFDKLCLVDLDTVHEDALTSFPLIKDSVDSNVLKNVFLMDGSSIESFYVEGMGGLGILGISCFKIDNSKVELVLKNDNQKVSVLVIPDRATCVVLNDLGCPDLFGDMFVGDFKTTCKKYNSNYCT